MEERADFIASVSYFSAAQGGLKIPVPSGYRTKIKFEFIDRETIGEQEFLEDEIAYPGDTIGAAIVLQSPEFFINALTEGTAFNFSQNDKIIGTGVIKQIFNSELRAH